MNEAPVEIVAVGAPGYDLTNLDRKPAIAAPVSRHLFRVLDLEGDRITFGQTFEC